MTLSRQSRVFYFALACLSLLAGCSRGTQATDGASTGALHALTGAHTRVAWVQGDGTDPDAGGDQLILMGFDSRDGKGERVILGERRSRTMPRLTPRGDPRPC